MPSRGEFDKPVQSLGVVQMTPHTIDYSNMRAVYTGIKNPEFFSYSGFSLEVATCRQLPLKTAKKN